MFCCVWIGVLFLKTKSRWCSELLLWLDVPDAAVYFCWMSWTKVLPLDLLASQWFLSLQNQWANIVPTFLIVLVMATVTDRESFGPPAPTVRHFVSKILNVYHINNLGALLLYLEVHPRVLGGRFGAECLVRDICQHWQDPHHRHQL